MANSTQHFEPQSDDDEEASSSYGGPQATQAFAVPESSTLYGGDDYEEEEHPHIQETQAFPGGGATQAFPMATFDDAPADDPMLYGSHIGLDSTQHFSVAEYAVVGDVDGENAVNTSGTSGEFDLSADNQQYVGGLEVVENQGQLDGSFDAVANEYEVAVEEVVDGDGAASDIEEMDEIASPDPEEGEEDQEQEEEEEEGDISARRVNRISSDDEEEREEGDDREAESSSKRGKASKVYVDDDEDGEERMSGERAASDDDADAEKKSEVGELIANIFGDSDEEPAASDTDEPKGHSRKAQHAASDSETKDSDDGDSKLVVAPDFISDFDLMMERRKAENRRRYRKRKDYDIVNDSDDVINELITQMKHAAKADTELNRQQKPALSKRKLLPTVVKQLKKSDLQSAFIELGAVTVIADWLCPLPDGSLPALEIRTELLKVLQQFPTLDHQILKSSSIGKAVMILYKHPKEIKENKERAGKLINEWARPIFSLQSDYRSLSKEERLQRDYEHMPLAKKRRMSSVDAENKPKTGAEEEERPLRPGDKGWIGRARVPQPSTKDYVVRPKWNVEAEVRNTSTKRGMSMMDRKIREIKERTKPKKAMRAVGVSIEGRKMP